MVEEEEEEEVEKVVERTVQTSLNQSVEGEKIKVRVKEKVKVKKMKPKLLTEIGLLIDPYDADEIFKYVLDRNEALLSPDNPDFVREQLRKIALLIPEKE